LPCKTLNPKNNDDTIHTKVLMNKHPFP